MNLALTRYAAIAALFLGTAQSVRAAWNDAVIFGKVTIMPMGGSNVNPDAYLSVTIPSASGVTGASDTSPTIWNLDTVAAGGVYDTFYNGGPGRFRVQNTGNIPAYVYIATGGAHYYSYVNDVAWTASDLLEKYLDEHGDLNGQPIVFLCSVPQPNFMRENLDYALAVSTDVTGVVPAWRPLSWVYYNGQFLRDSSGYFEENILSPSSSLENECFAYLSYMRPGETTPFDLKFWAPLFDGFGNFWFAIRIEASGFKLWDHER